MSAERPAASVPEIVIHDPRGMGVAITWTEGEYVTTRQIATRAAELLGYDLRGSAFTLQPREGEEPRYARNYDEPVPTQGEWDLVEVGLNV